MKPASAIAIILVAAILSGCAASQQASREISPLRGDDVVLIFWHDSHFNRTLMEKVSEYAVNKGYKVVSDEEYNADLYRAGDYAAVVFLAKLEAKGSLKIVEAFREKYENTGNIIIAISHEWDVEDTEVTRTYDAITAASKVFEQEEVLGKITAKLNSIL